MTTATTNVSAAREPRLLGQTVVVIGGSAGIGLETARLARSEGAEVVLTGRDPERLEQAARELSARSSAAFDADDAAAVKRFFDELPAPIDHVLVAAYTRGSPRAHARQPPRGGGPRPRPARDAGPRDRTQRGPQDAARRHAAADGRQPEEVRSRGRDHPRRVRGAAAVHRALALELAPVRVNLIQAGFVDTALATSYFADEAAVEARREELRATLPIGRVVGPADVAALAVHLMTNTAVTGATYDIDGGQRLIT